MNYNAVTENVTNTRIQTPIKHSLTVSQAKRKDTKRLYS
tara:strand:- start:3834 stop:3950 length:117 start_codon:yes stop_codon:yes gene_type:complete